MSLTEQRERVTEYARARGIELVRVVHESASGGVREGELFSWEHRPVLSDLLEDARRGAYDVLVVARFDRLSRDAATTTIIQRMLKQHGVQLVSCAEDNGDSATGRLMRHTLAGFAEYERDLIRERFAFGKAQRKRQGKHVTGGHPYGYHTPGRRGELEPLEHEAKVVRRIFRDVLDGMTPAAIARGLNRDGIPSPRGKTWTRQSVLVILRNDVYCGERYGVRRAHPAIVAKRTFNSAQAALAARAR